LSVTDAGRQRLLGPVDFEMSGRGLGGVLTLIRNRLAGADVPVKAGIEAAGHYHRPLLAPSVWPAGWQVLELNPAHVAEQRRVQGRRNRRRAGPDARHSYGGRIPRYAGPAPKPPAATHASERPPPGARTAMPGHALDRTYSQLDWRCRNGCPVVDFNDFRIQQARPYAILRHTRWSPVPAFR
jgi:hypothetical protein